ncbi:MAG: hypothetical protein BZY79_00430 [SAR202 cluster bacterium Casp-Chloro-G4]|nr:hypothetical protein [Chloroflexota bacterium]MDA1226896.1 hypothetical protein [Chloroflexota bacterium]PKB62068.1 MAG: hypothetical protein BZY79_00430 [SAR202 cluster bacterium Casp-Chloro-G4]
MDPAALGPFEWSELGKLLVSLWMVVLFVVLMAANMIVGHNFLPSFVMSGHLPNYWQKARIAFYSFAIICFGLAMFFLYRVIDLAGILRNFWADYYI